MLTFTISGDNTSRSKPLFEAAYQCHHRYARQNVLPAKARPSRDSPTNLSTLRPSRYRQILFGETRRPRPGAPCLDEDVTYQTRPTGVHLRWRPPLMSETNSQGCVVIFLSNFLALLIKVDAAGRGNREILGGILVAVNVLLFVAVVFATWFATHQAIADTRDGAEALGVARAVLTFEKRAAASARFTRQQTSAPLASSPSVAPGLRPREGDVSRAASGKGPAAAGSITRGDGDRAESSHAIEREAWWEAKKDET